MTYRLLFELVLFLSPFAAFGIYRLARQEAIEEGRKPWPITILFGAGAVLAVLAWVVLILLDRGSGETCIERARFENGRVIPAQEVPCPKDRSHLGEAASSDPGGRANGLGGADPAGQDTPPGPLETPPTDDPPASDTLPDADPPQ